MALAAKLASASNASDSHLDGGTLQLIQANGAIDTTNPLYQLPLAGLFPQQPTYPQVDDHFSAGLAGDIDDYTQAHLSAIQLTASVLGIPDTAIAGSFGEEHRTFNYLKDSWLDGQGLQTIQLMPGPSQEGFPTFVARTDQNGFLEGLYTQDLPQILRGVLQGPNNLGGVAARIADPLKIDVGFGNVNFGTAMYLVKQYIANPAYQTDPLGLRQYDGHYDNLYRDMLSSQSDTFVKVVGLKLADVQNFYLNGTGVSNPVVAAQLHDAYQNSSGAARDELLDAGYRSSYSYVARTAASTGVVGPIQRSGYYDYFNDSRSVGRHGKLPPWRH